MKYTNKTLLVAVNAKYIHTSLAVRTLYAYASCSELSWAEFNINESVESVCADIYRSGEDIIAFSCYIWNIEFILKTARRLKTIKPGIKIIFGGPEVSYDASVYMNRFPFIDAIIRGEGEKTLDAILKSGSLDHNGITFRNTDKTLTIRPDMPLITNISSIPFPYTEDDIEKSKNKLIYYESSRGCPFNCSYCLSSTSHIVRFRDIELVKNELMFFIKHDVKIVKFTDRTFNANKYRTKEILRFLIDNAARTTFHFEVAADLLDSETLEILSAAPKGLFQLEIGVQSTNPKTLNAICRKSNIEKIRTTVQRIREFGNIHIHLDLIVGLPFEDLQSFKRSFNDVFDMSPHVLQLGFLKLLKGTKLRNESAGTAFTSEPPYEILRNEHISYEDILFLKSVEDIVEKFYNSEAFSKSLGYLIRFFHSPFEFFESLAAFYSEQGFQNIGVSRERLYEILLAFSQTVKAADNKTMVDLLLFDYLKNNKPRTPSWADRTPVLKEKFQILTPEFIRQKLPEYSDMRPKEIIKKIYFERFFNPERIVIFDNAHNRVIEL